MGSQMPWSFVQAASPYVIIRPVRRGVRFLAVYRSSYYLCNRLTLEGGLSSRDEG